MVGHAADPVLAVIDPVHEGAALGDDQEHDQQDRKDAPEVQAPLEGFDAFVG